MPGVPLVSFGSGGYGGGFGPRGATQSSSKSIWGGPSNLEWGNLSTSWALSASQARLRQRLVDAANPELAAVVGFAAHDPGGPVDVGDPPVPVDWSIESSPVAPPIGVHTVLPFPVGGGQPKSPTPAPRPPPPPPAEVQEEFWPVEIEEHPEGDWPAGSIFAPGQVWGPTGTEHQPNPLDEEEEMAIDWGGAVSGFIDALQGQAPGGALPSGLPSYFAGASTGVGPTQIPGGSAAMPPSGAFRVNQYGQVVRCRRRRRRLLTNSDLKDLAALKTITGNNDALKMAVIKAVR